MLEDYKNKVNITLVLGVIALCFGGFMLYLCVERTGFLSILAAVLAPLFMLIGFGLYTLHLYFYAKGKGYDGSLGLRAAWSPFANWYLMFLPDRHKKKYSKPKNQDEQKE